MLAAMHHIQQKIPKFLKILIFFPRSMTSHKELLFVSSSRDINFVKKIHIGVVRGLQTWIFVLNYWACKPHLSMRYLKNQNCRTLKMGSCFFKLLFGCPTINFWPPFSRGQSDSPDVKHYVFIYSTRRSSGAS